MMKTQSKASKERAQVLAWMRTGAEIDQPQALDNFQCFNLKDRIKELRKEGYKIVREPRINGARYSCYRLVAPPKNELKEERAAMADRIVELLDELAPLWELYGYKKP